MKEKSSCCDLSRLFWFPNEWQVAAILLQPSPLTLPPDSRTEVPGTEMAVGDDGHGQADQAVVIGPKCPHGSQSMGSGWGAGIPQAKGREARGDGVEREASACRQDLWRASFNCAWPTWSHDEGRAREVGQGPGRLPPQVSDLQARGVLPAEHLPQSTSPAHRPWSELV